MKTGDLVKMMFSFYEGIGVITKVTQCIHRNRSTIWYTVHWQMARWATNTRLLNWR